MAVPTTDIWTYAANKVDNKSILMRVGHSSRFHGIRSATQSQGSAASKIGGGLLAVGRASLSLIPIPAVGSLISAVETAIEGKIRSHLHQRHITNSAATALTAEQLGNNVKFGWKEATVENMDRYRFKVEQAVQEANAAITQWNGQKAAADASDHQCDARLTLALKLAQAERRNRILAKELKNLTILIEGTTKWAEAMSKGLADAKTKLSADMVAALDAEKSRVNLGGTPAQQTKELEDIVLQGHAKCGEFCVHSGYAAQTRWDSYRQTIAGVVNTLQQPFSPESMLSLNKSSFAVGDTLSNY